MPEAKNQAAAIDQVRKLQREYMNKMCPVFRKRCSGTDCTGFYEGGITPFQREDEKAFKIFPPCCTSPMVTGIISTVQK